MEAATSSTSVEVIVVDDSASASLRQRRIKRLFIGLALLSIIINLDGGAVPAALMHIERTFDLSIALVGLVGMLVYQGIAIGCLIVGPLLNIVSPTRATQATIILNMGATFGFGAAQSSAMLLIFRVSIGILQAIPAVYFPVWVDEFAPESSATIWMAVIQAGAPLGIMAGYVFSGILTSNAPEARCMPTDITCAWRIPFYLQSCTLVLFSLGALLVPKSIYDLPKHRDEKLVGDEDGDDGACGGFASISEASATAEPAAVKSAEGPSSVASLEAPSARTSMSSTSVERLTQAFLPMAMRNTIGEPRYSFVAVPEAPPQPISAERRERSDKWIRRLSSTPMAVPSELSDQSMVEGQTPGSQASSPGGGAPRASHVRASHYGRPSMTVLDDDGSAAGGRPRVVSAIDLFRPSVLGGDTDRMSMQSNGSAVSTGSSATKKAAPFKPKLETVAQSSANLSESIAAAEAEDAAKPPAKGQSSETLTANGEAPPRKRSALMQLLTNGVYMCTVMAVSCLFFVVTGIQFWVTKYIVEVIGMEQTYVTPAFGGTSIVAPLLGVFAGGAFIDKIGGYKGASAMASTLKCCAVFAACAAIAAIACAIVPKAIAQGSDGDNGNVVGGFASCIGLIAVTLIFGGAVIPAATGVIVSSVPWELRNLGSAFSMLIFQQFGYALAPIVSAGVAESVQVSSEDEAALTAQWQLGGFNTSGALRSIGQISLAEQLEGGNTTAAVYLQIDAIPLEAVIEGTRRRLSIETCFLVVMLWGLFGVCFMTLAAVFASCHKAEAEKEESMRSEKVSSRSSAGPAGAPQLGSLEATSASSAQAQL